MNLTIKPTTWTLTDSSADAPIRVFHFEDEHGLSAFYRVERLLGGRLIVRVTFGTDDDKPAQRHYARAHAARLLSVCWDTMGDLAQPGEDPLEIDEHGMPELHGTRVEVSGMGAVLLTASFFGAAGEVLFNTYA